MKYYLSKILNRLRGYQSLDSLIKMGLSVGKNFQMLEQCNLEYHHCWLISIGDNVTLAPRVHILAHDASTKQFLGYAKIGKVSIGNNVFIGAGSIVLPNTTIGSNVIIGAGSVVSKDIPSNSVATGNPARVLSTTDAYLNKHKEMLKENPIYNESWTVRGKITNEMKQTMVNNLRTNIGYVE